MINLNTYVKDIHTQEPLPGASVIMTDRNGKAIPLNGVPIIGRKTDENGKLIMPIALDDGYITVSYVGYATITHPADDYRNDIIYLAPKALSPTKELVITGKRITTKPTQKPTYKPKQKNYLHGPLR